MSIAEELTNASTRRPSNTRGSCLLCRILSDLPTPDADAVRESRIAAEELAAVLTKNGHQIGASTIRTHRRKGH